MRLSLRVLVAEAAPDGIWLGSSVLIFEQVQADQRPAAQVLDNNLHTAESYLSHRDTACSTVLRIFEFLDARHAAGSHIDCHMGASLRRLSCNSAAESENFLYRLREGRRWLPLGLYAPQKELVRQLEVTSVSACCTAAARHCWVECKLRAPHVKAATVRSETCLKSEM